MRMKNSKIYPILASQYFGTSSHAPELLAELFGQHSWQFLFLYEHLLFLLQQFSLHLPKPMSKIIKEQTLKIVNK